MLKRVITPEELQGGYTVRVGDLEVTRPYRVARRLADGTVLVFEPAVEFRDGKYVLVDGLSREVPS